MQIFNIEHNPESEMVEVQPTPYFKQLSPEERIECLKQMLHDTGDMLDAAARALSPSGSIDLWNRNLKR